MFRALLLALLLVASASRGAFAEVIIELHPVPSADLPGAGLAAATGAAGEDAGPGMEPRSLFAASNVPSPSIWFVPNFRVNTTTFSDTTLWSARNEGLASVNVTVEYYDKFFDLQKAEMLTLEPRELRPVNVRDVAGLPVDPDGFARGLVRLTPNGPISVDVLQVNPSDNFAFGELGFTTEDFCTAWQVRFLSFGAGPGSIASFLINGPRGGGPADPPSVSGDVYNEQGAFINSFTIRTDQWFFEVELLDFVLGGTNFGSIELEIQPLFAPAGLVNVSHSAEGRFSVGLRAVCKDLP